MRVNVRAVLLCSSLVLCAAEASARQEQRLQPTTLPPVTSPEDVINEDPEARRNWKRERYEGGLSADDRDAFLAALAQQRATHGARMTPATGTQPGQWQFLGPVRSNWLQNGVRVTASDTGRIRGFALDPRSPDVVYVLTSGGGLWKTTNFLAPKPTWQPISDYVGVTSGGAVALGSNPDHVYLGLGDAFDVTIGGLFTRSLDGGRTWSTVQTLGAATVVNDIEVVAVNGVDHVYVATNNGLFRSVDGGQTFARVGGLGSFVVWSLAKTSTGWAATIALPGGTNQYVAGLVVFSPNGLAWSVASGPVGVGRTTLAVGAPGDATVYAFAAHLMGNAIVQQDLYRSDDGGQTYQALGLASKQPEPNPLYDDLDVMGGQAFYNHMVLVDPRDADRNTVYLGGQLYSVRTTDGGRTWRVIADWLAQGGLPYVHADYHAAVLDPRTGMLLFGTDGGLFVSQDGGRSFSDLKNDGIGSYLVYAMASHPKHTDDVLIGLQDNGTRLRIGRSGTFNQVFGGDGFGVGWSQATNSNSIGSVYYSYIFRTTLNPPATQNKWFVGFTGIEEVFVPAKTFFVTQIATPASTADPTGATFFHPTRCRLYRTDNGAQTWQPILELVPSRDCSPTSPIQVRGVQHAVGVSPVDTNSLGVALTAGRFGFTTDGGTTWNVLRPSFAGVPEAAVSFTSTVAYADAQTIYVGFENPNPGTPLAGKSVDGGLTWTRADAGLASPVQKLAVNPTNAQDLFAATWIGVFRSTDGGASWAYFGQGLPLVQVSDLYIPPDGAFLRVSTYGRGVWETRLR